MQGINDYNNQAAMIVGDDPNDISEYIKTYHRELFKENTKIKIRGYEVKGVKNSSNGEIDKVKISSNGISKEVDIKGAKSLFSEAIEKKIKEDYVVKKGKSYYITVSGVKNEEIIKKKLKYDKITTELLKDFLESNFITITSSYRLVSIGSMLSRIKNMFSFSGLISEFSTVMDDIESNCGLIGTECLNIEESLDTFIIINSVMFKNNFYPIGNYSIVDDTIIQQYGNKSFNSSVESIIDKSSTRGFHVQGLKNKSKKRNTPKKQKKKSIKLVNK